MPDASSMCNMNSTCEPAWGRRCMLQAIMWESREACRQGSSWPGIHNDRCTNWG